MNQNSIRKLCDICQSTRHNAYQNPKCKHSYCLNCYQSCTHQNICLIKGCNTQNKVNEITQYFEGDQRPLKEEQSIKSYNNSTISTQSSTRSQINNKSKQYASPNETYYDLTQNQAKSTKIEQAATLNYCAVCLYYMRDDLLKQQTQAKKIHPILDCQLHTICVGCFSRYFENQKSKLYFCEICMRLIR